MSNVTAGIGRGQLLHLEEHKAKKKEIYGKYKDAFSDIENSEITPDIIMDALDAENIESRPVWKPMHLQPVFAQYDFIPHNEDGASVGEDVFNRGLCLPSDVKNTDEDMELIIGIIRGCFGK